MVVSGKLLGLVFSALFLLSNGPSCPSEVEREWCAANLVIGRLHTNIYREIRQKDSDVNIRPPHSFLVSGRIPI